MMTLNSKPKKKSTVEYYVFLSNNTYREFLPKKKLVEYFYQIEQYLQGFMFLTSQLTSIPFLT